ncbi:MAG: hypothetical protein ACLFSQ_09025 [Candidatus Zixiibacteriota bacterium]
MKNGIAIILISILGISAISADNDSEGFRLDLNYSCGLENSHGPSEYRLTIGTDENATGQLDKNLDSPSPPIPPEICYANLIAPEGSPPFNILWTDIRAIKKYQKWQLHSIRNIGGGHINFDKETVPDYYTIFINGANIKKLDNPSVPVSESDTTVMIFSIQDNLDDRCAAPKPEQLAGKTFIKLYQGDKKMATVDPVLSEKDSPMVIFDTNIENGFYRYEMTIDDAEPLSGRIYVP